MIENQYDKLVTPIKAYISFTNQEGYERCVKRLSCEDTIGNKNKYKVEMKILDQDIRIVAATEPTNIIWENLEVFGNIIQKRVCYAVIVIIVFLIGMFICFSFLK